MRKYAITGINSLPDARSVGGSPWSAIAGLWAIIWVSDQEGILVRLEVF